MDLRETLNLPDAAFTIPMKANLPQLEPQIQAQWEAQGLYERIQEHRKDSPTFVLHDGPPYTNGPVHIGTALNKVLKDFAVKSRTLLGFRAPYVPGYDNHGLPIEQAVIKKFAEQKLHPDVVTLRKACREHAEQFIGLQSAQFKRLGVFGMWDRPYTTMDYAFEAEIIRVFKRLVEGGYIYRGLRPTQWSPTQRTALADTEVVYKDHTSTAIYVRFALKEDPNRLFEAYPNLYAVIWTTTPWTIPGNLAIAFHPEYDYAIVQHGMDHYLLLDSLVEKTAGALGWGAFRKVGKIQGINLDHAVFEHPIYGRDSLAVIADYITTEDGTGVVHTAPGHGRDDFMTGQRYGLPVLCPVDERGVLTAEAGEFEGVHYKQCDTVVVERLRDLGHLLASSSYTHSYPYSERDDQPVIFRATEQWFVSIDFDGLRDRMLEQIEGVTWLPASGKNRIQAMVGGRPDWCISRQRPWGVGIPIFYGASTRRPVMDPEAIECVAHMVERYGSDAWFERDATDILPKGYVHPDTGETEFLKETDVLDVWFDSGSTSLCVLEGYVEPRWQEPWPADLYLEGSDQHRGWFNSSLVIGTAVKGSAPYRCVLTHGFVVDEKGLKMSKRLGNVVDPVAASDQYGADVLRYWVAGVDWENDVPCSDNLLRQFGESYRTVRNTLRFLLSNLSDWDPALNPSLNDLDEWLVEQVDLLVDDCLGAYERFDFGAVMTSVHNFCARELSRFYLDAIKDRMYCDGKDWLSRRSAQAACLYALRKLTLLVAPVLCHTAEEVYQRLPGDKLFSVHAEVLARPSADRMAQIEASDFQIRYAQLLEARARVFAEFEAWKEASGVKDSQDALVHLTDDAATLAVLRGLGEELPTLLKVSWVELAEGPRAVRFEPSPYPQCDRSRLRRPDVQETNGVHLTSRDRRALGWE